MADMNKEYRLERMNNYAGTQVTERTYNLTIGLTLLWGVLINVVMATFFVYQILSITKPKSKKEAEAGTAKKTSRKKSAE